MWSKGSDGRGKLKCRKKGLSAGRCIVAGVGGMLQDDKGLEALFGYEIPASKNLR